MMYTFNLSGLNQLAAVLPSTATAGAYDLRVSNGGTTSAPFRMNIVARKPDIVTANGELRRLDRASRALRRRDKILSELQLFSGGCA